jgi:hypothetical protein
MGMQDLLASWRDFFLLACTIGATLLGLLFVSVSVNAATILSGEHAYLKLLAEQAYQSYMIVVLVGLLYVFPGRDWNGDAQVFGFMGLGGLAWSAYRVVRLVGTPLMKFGLMRTIRRMLSPIAAYFLMCIAGLWMQRQTASGPLVLAGAAAITLVVGATATSWDLLIQVGKLRQEK